MRFIVHEGLYDEFVSCFSSRMLESTPAPLSSFLLAADRLQAQVASAVAKGARLRAAGEKQGLGILRPY